MVLHASLTSFRKLSIPRDTLAEVPGFGAEKINGAFSLTGKEKGDAALMIETVQDFLGIDINHVVIVDFEGFADFIDTLGGITVDLPNKVCGDISGGKSQGGVSLKLTPGEHTLESQKALALARLRKNECDPSEDDLDRAARQQLILNGIKGRLTDPLRLPYNFVKGPLIGWNAPKAFVSDMGGIALPQVAIAAIFGGNDKTNVLQPSGTGPGGSLFISQGECREAVEELTGSAPDNEPQLLALSDLSVRRLSGAQPPKLSPRRPCSSLPIPSRTWTSPASSRSSPSLTSSPTCPRPRMTRSRRLWSRAAFLLALVVGVVEARSLEVHCDRVEDALDRRPAFLAGGDGIVGHALEDLEGWPFSAAVFVDRHG